MNRSSLMRVALAASTAVFLFAGIATRARSEVVAAVPEEGTGTPIWTNIEADNYDQRAHFAAGIRKLSAKLDDQIRVLKAKRATMTTDTKDWDLAFQEVEASRTYLTGMMDELQKADTPERWLDAKGRVAVAWKRSQVAVDKMNTTVTS